MESAVENRTAKAEGGQLGGKIGPQVGVLVLGMHRSGTSAVTRLINLLGAQLPGNLMVATQEVNPTGFWESYDVAAFNDGLLAACGARWDSMLLQQPASLPEETYQHWQDQADALLQHHFPGKAMFVLKDPRIARLLPFWLAAFRRRAIVPCPVMVVRHPMEVVDSLRRRDGFATDKTLYLWLRHLLDALLKTGRMRYGLVVYQELLQDWRTSLTRLQADTGIVWQHTPESIADQVAGFLSPQLHHHRHGRFSLPRQGSIGRMATLLYTSLVARASDLPGLARMLDRELAEWEGWFRAMEAT